MNRALWLVVLAACSGGSGKDGTTDTGAEPTGTTTPPAADWCRVQGIFRSRCELCHSPGNLQGDLDLQTDGYAAIVGVTSAAFGDVLVAPGDPDGSLLYRKMAGTQAADEGDPMPTTGLVSADTLQVVHDWIADGASQACDGGPTTPTPTGQVHPPGWEDRGAHGLATKLQTDGDCRDCHGADLQGGTAEVSCDSCHVADWDTTCTYCHGGELDPTGAPPQDIDDETDLEQISFAPHHEHVAGARHLAVDCDGCHVVPTDALTPGHLFDDPTAGQAEVDLSGGLSPAGTYAGGTCSDLYCHGNGRGSNGTISAGDGRRTCESCHTTNGLGGEHDQHLGEGIDCEECHPDVNGTGISDPDLHVNGAVEVEPGGTVTFDGDSCSGSCHFESHNDRDW